MELMTKQQVERVKQSAQGTGRSDSPWRTHVEEMWRKTVIRRLCKYLPLNSQMQAVIAADVREEFGGDIDVDAVIEGGPQGPNQDTVEAVRRSTTITKEATKDVIGVEAQSVKEQPPPPEEAPPPEAPPGWDDAPLDGFQ